MFFITLVVLIFTAIMMDSFSAIGKSICLGLSSFCMVSIISILIFYKPVETVTGNYKVINFIDDRQLKQPIIEREIHKKYWMIPMFSGNVWREK